MSDFTTEVRRNPFCKLETFLGWDFTLLDAKLPDTVRRDNSKATNEHVLLHYKRQQRLGTLALLRQAWNRKTVIGAAGGHPKQLRGGTDAGAGTASDMQSRAAHLAQLLQLRRVSRVHGKDGWGVVEPFGRAVVMYL